SGLRNEEREITLRILVTDSGMSHVIVGEAHVRFGRAAEAGERRENAAVQTENGSEGDDASAHFDADDAFANLVRRGGMNTGDRSGLGLRRVGAAGRSWKGRERGRGDGQTAGSKRRQNQQETNGKPQSHGSV